MTSPDARKTLPTLRREWETCTKCDLGLWRSANKGQFVFGEGARRGIMLIGEGPGRSEEEEGRPFVGESGLILRKVLGRLGITEETCYITNIVSCRSCEAVLDDNGLPMMRRGRPAYKDAPPLPPHIEACRDRLYEEIYLVDPVLIVAMGGTAAKTLTGGHLSILAERGKERFIEIPGATQRAVLTDKKRAWAHKVKGKVVTPTEQNGVNYLMLPTLHPSYVSRQIEDRSRESPLKLLIQDLRLAVKIYERYMLELFSAVPTGSSDTSEDSIEQLVGENDGD
jgi:DNA polymerase